MSCYPAFPSTGAIPPAEFYNIKGLAGWLNVNPQYKEYFVGYFPFLLRPVFVTSTLSTLQYRPYDVPLASNVTTLSQEEGLLYNQQLALFRKVYGFNSNAFVNYKCNNSPGPIYYTYKDHQERIQMRSALQLVEKLYNFQAMAEASTINWVVPFPIRN